MLGGHRKFQFLAMEQNVPIPKCVQMHVEELTQCVMSKYSTQYSKIATFSRAKWLPIYCDLLDSERHNDFFLIFFCLEIRKEKESFARKIENVTNIVSKNVLRYLLHFTSIMNGQENLFP